MIEFMPYRYLPRSVKLRVIAACARSGLLNFEDWEWAYHDQHGLHRGQHIGQASGPVRYEV